MLHRQHRKHPPQEALHWTCPSPVSQRQACTAPQLTVYNLQSVLSGGSSRVNVIKTSTYYLFLCPRYWSPPVVQIRQDWWMWICLKLKQAVDNEKGWLESPYQLKRILRYAEQEDCTQSSVQSQEVKQLLLQTFQASHHWHRTVPSTPERIIVYGKAPSGVVQLSSLKMACDGKILNTCNARPLSR